MTLPLGLLASAKSGWAPTSLASLAAWHDASAISGLSDGDAVASWSDSSTGGKTLTQVTASKKPTYKTGIRNSKPVVRFDSGDVINGTYVSASTITWAFVVSVGGSGTRGLTYDGWGAASATPYIGGGFMIYSNTRTLYGHGTFGLMNIGGTYTNSTWERWIMVAGSGYVDLYVNGTRTIQNGGSWADGTNASAVLRIGGSDGDPEFYSGGMDVAESIIYATAHSGRGATLSGDLATLDSYLAQKWGF